MFYKTKRRRRRQQQIKNGVQKNKWVKDSQTE